MRWWIGMCLGLVLCTASLSYPDDRRGSPFPPDEHWEGYRTWTPDRYSRRRGLVVPNQFTEEALTQQAKTMLLTSRLNVMTSIIELRRAAHEIDRDTVYNPTRTRMPPPRGFFQQLNTFIEELERELAAVQKELQQGKDTSHAP